MIPKQEGERSNVGEKRAIGQTSDPEAEIVDGCVQSAPAPRCCLSLDNLQPLARQDVQRTWSIAKRERGNVE